MAFTALSSCQIYFMLLIFCSFLYIRKDSIYIKDLYIKAFKKSYHYQGFKLSWLYSKNIIILFKTFKFCFNLREQQPANTFAC